MSAGCGDVVAGGKLWYCAVDEAVVGVKGLEVMPALLMPAENCEGSLRPETRVKPRSLGGGSSTLRFEWRKSAGTAVMSGLRPARSAIPG